MSANTGNLCVLVMQFHGSEKIFNPSGFSSFTFKIFNNFSLFDGMTVEKVRFGAIVITL